MPYAGELSALITAVLWVGSSYAFTFATKRIGSVQLNIDRLLIASLLLIITIFLFKLDYGMTSHQLTFLALSGVMGLSFGDTFLFKAYQLIGNRISLLLLSMAPVLTALFAYIFLDEGLSFQAGAGMLLTLAGICLVILEKRGDERATKNYLGIFYGFMAACGQAGSILLAKVAFDSGEVDKMTATFIRIIGAVILILPAAILFRRYKNPFKLYSMDKKAFRLTMAGSVLGPYLGITFSLMAIAYTKAGIAATLMSTMPIIMLPVARFYFKEKFTWKAVVGAIIAVAGIAIIFLR
jgi:drug/metabolite transporter (DMT)-like permease